MTSERSTESLAYLPPSLFQANAHDPAEMEVNALVKANVSAPKVTKETSAQSVSPPPRNQPGLGALLARSFWTYCMLPGPCMSLSPPTSLLPLSEQRHCMNPLHVKK